MSAIGAIFSVHGVSAEELATMEQTLGQIPHDNAGSMRKGHMALAACVYHTTGPSAAQHQPIAGADGQLFAMFDGHLLNPKELQTDLEAKGVAVQSGSDVEIALKAYEAWGDDCANRMQGEFALIIADYRKGLIFAARDHLGFVPLYYRHEEGRLILASDFRTIAALSRQPMEPNRRFLAQIMSNKWYLRDETPWTDVERLIRAHTLSYSGKTLNTQRYWTPPTDVSIRYKRDEDYVEHYREVLTDSVRRSSRSDRPIGIAVSGGLDSSSIFSLAHALEKEGKFLAPGFAGCLLYTSPSPRDS